MDALSRSENVTPLCSIYWLIKPTKNGKIGVTSVSPLGISVIEAIRLFYRDSLSTSSWLSWAT
jgi:hypothetical protein